MKDFYTSSQICAKLKLDRRRLSELIKDRLSSSDYIKLNPTTFLYKQSAIKKLKGKK